LDLNHHARRHDHEARKSKRLAEEAAAARAAGRAAIAEAAALNLWKGRWVHARACVCAHVRVHACVCVRMCVCMRVCVCLRKCALIQSCMVLGVRVAPTLNSHPCLGRLEDRVDAALGLASANKAMIFDGSKAYLKEKAAHQRTLGEVVLAPEVAVEAQIG